MTRAAPRGSLSDSVREGVLGDASRGTVLRKSRSARLDQAPCARQTSAPMLPVSFAAVLAELADDETVGHVYLSARG